MTKIKIATRGSALALWQANTVKDALLEKNPELEAELVILKTTGDVTLDKPLDKIGDKGMFTKELERALVDGDADICVHSMKDVPNELAPGCGIVAMLPRADVRDALVCGPRLDGVTALEDVFEGAKIGTGSLRRAAQLRSRFPQIEPKGIRGNVDTRLRKAYGDEYDGAILACAGMVRMGEEDKIACRIPADVMIPAAGQGAVGIEARTDDEEILNLCSQINDEKTFRCVAAERFVLNALGGSCKVPMGVYARDAKDGFTIDAIVLSLDGSRVARVTCVAEAGESPCETAQRVVEELRAADAAAILSEILESGE